MIHLMLAVLGLVGLARALYCAWQMDGPAAGIVRRATNAAMGAGSVALLWASWAAPR